MKKTNEQVEQQAKRIYAALWAMDCRIPGNVHKRRVRLNMVEYFACRRLHPDFFKRTDLTFCGIARREEKRVTESEEYYKKYYAWEETA